MTADEKDVVRGLQAVGKATGTLREQISDLVTASKAAGAADNQLSQQRLAALAPILAKQKELKASTAELEKQLKEGKITADQYKTAFEGIAKESNTLTTELRQLQAQVKEDSDDLKKAGTIIGQTEDKTQKYSRAVAELDRLKQKGILSSKQHAQAIAAESAKLSETGDAAGKSGGLISGLTGKMGGFVAGLTSVSAIIALLKAEYDALIERQGKSRDANISLATEQEALLQNLGGADPTQTTDNIQKLSRTSGVKEENITRAVNEAMAARGDMAVSTVIDAVASASKVRKFAPTELAGLAGATIDTQKQTGLGTDESIGFLMQMQAQSRVKSLKGVGENLTPAVGGIMNFGADRQTSAAILASLSHGMGDTTGAQTGTSGIQLAKQLREFGGGADIATTITKLQQDPAARKKFLDGASFEAKALPAVESLLSGGTQAKQYAAAKSAMQANPLDTLNTAIANRGAMSSIGLAEKDLSLGNAVDQFRLQDREGGESAIVRDRMTELRRAMGEGKLSSEVSSAMDDLESGGKQSVAGALGKLQAQSSLMSQGKTYHTEKLDTRTFGLEDMFKDSYAPNTAAGREVKRNLADKEFMRQAKLLEEVVVLLSTQVEMEKAANANNQQRAHAGIVGNRANDPERN